MAGAHAIEVSTSLDSSSGASGPLELVYTRTAQGRSRCCHQRSQTRQGCGRLPVDTPHLALAFPANRTSWSKSCRRLTPTLSLRGSNDQSARIALPWIDKVKAVLEMWWPGDEGGWSKPQTFFSAKPAPRRTPARDLGEEPHRLRFAATDPNHPERSLKVSTAKPHTARSVNVGAAGSTSRRSIRSSAFGHGLSYTTFEYSGLKVAKNSDGGLEVHVTIKNTGSAASDEVLSRSILGAPGKVPDGACSSLCALWFAFDRIHLGAGESKTVSLQHPSRANSSTGRPRTINDMDKPQLRLARRECWSGLLTRSAPDAIDQSSLFHRAEHGAGISACRSLLFVEICLAGRRPLVRHWQTGFGEVQFLPPRLGFATARQIRKDRPSYEAFFVS